MFRREELNQPFALQQNFPKLKNTYLHAALYLNFPPVAILVAKLCHVQTTINEDQWKYYSNEPIKRDIDTNFPNRELTYIPCVHIDRSYTPTR